LPRNTPILSVPELATIISMILPLLSLPKKAEYVWEPLPVKYVWLAKVLSSFAKSITKLLVP
jgi:hypothetical protein